ncbi:heterokaryon incompatibility protein-domain-containing protein [Pyrenochaeta sp. MPI-SDFR-AT-0127]|nr:heterokaryon incompatibility protein-domain-containing protein [Pyrenochaeta sp. MPI-SDFR-AT-0127]
MGIRHILATSHGNDIPQYAVLSHTWGKDEEEVTYKDLVDRTGDEKPGYLKIRFCAKQAAEDRLQYFWVDTCCIDKSSSTELSEAINSMFTWYQNAAKCYVYLSDVSIQDFAQDRQAFHKSRWFTRGWTLQELVAPTVVEFFSVEGEHIGDKNIMVHDISSCTGLPIDVLQGRLLSHFSFDERMSWTEKRQTKRIEDAAYCLLGMFGICMPLLYGEGRSRAFSRLRKEEIKTNKKAFNDPNWPEPGQHRNTRCFISPECL